MISKRVIFLFIMLPVLAYGAPGKSKKHVAPVFCERTVLINATPETVWKLLTDINSWPHIFKNVSCAKMNGPLHPNVTFNWKSGGIFIHSTLRVVHPEEELAWSGRAYTITAFHDWHVRAMNNGTELTVRENMSGLIAHLFKRLLNRSLSKDMSESLKQLKEACERTGSY